MTISDGDRAWFVSWKTTRPDQQRTCQGRQRIMPELDTLILVNPSRRVVRLFTILACVCLVPAGVCGVLLALGGRFDPATHSDASVGCLATLFACGAIALAMLLSAAISLPFARTIDRDFAAFRRGDLLADWIFPPDEWNAYLTRERQRGGKARLGALGLIFAPLALVSAFVAFGLGSNLAERVGFAAAAWGVLAALAGLAFVLLRAASRRKFSRIVRAPRVLIGKTGVYYAENFALWGSNMLKLLDIRVVPGDPPTLVFTVGPGSAARAVGAVLGVASLAAGSGSAGMAMSNTIRQTIVPIPSARLAEAEQLVRTLSQPLRAAPARSAEIRPVLVDRPRAAANDGPAPPRSAARKRFSARALWLTAGSELVVGLVLILLANPSTSDQGAAVGAFGVIGDLCGFLLWIASVPTAIFALIRSLRSH
jgi:hypothetical protein